MTPSLIISGVIALSNNLGHDLLELLAHGVRRIAVTNRRALQFVCRTELRVRSGREVLDSTSMGVYRVSIE
jgi:hypothetical protein